LNTLLLAESRKRIPAPQLVLLGCSTLRRSGRAALLALLTHELVHECTTVLCRLGTARFYLGEVCVSLGV
jgi:hypothetical protein